MKLLKSEHCAIQLMLREELIEETAPFILAGALERPFNPAAYYGYSKSQGSDC